jgi:hypothetical protein
MEMMRVVVQTNHAVRGSGSRGWARLGRHGLAPHTGGAILGADERAARGILETGIQD